MKRLSLWFPAIVCLTSTVVLLYPLSKGLGISGHDAGPHYIRMQLFSAALREGQFPVRWIEIPLLNLSHPLFEFYPTLFYFLGTIATFFGANYIQAAAYSLLLATILGWMAMYFLVRRIVGQGGSFAGIVSATLSLFTPYRLSQLYVRAAFPEFLATSALPLIFLGTLMIFKNKKAVSLWWGVIWEAVGLTAVAAAHQPTLLMAALPIVGWVILLWLSTRSNLRLVLASLGFALGFGLSAFFILPQVFERTYVQLNHLTQGYFDFHQHFAYFSQLIYSPWGYGVSQPGPNDGMSFQMGGLNWLVLLAAIAGIIYAIAGKNNRSRKDLKSDRTNQVIVFFIAVTAYGLFMATDWSQTIWDILPGFSFIQYPWRFLTLTTFATSVLAGVLWATWESKTPVRILKTLVATLVLVIIFIANVQYIAPQEYFPASDLNLHDPQVIRGISASDPLFGVEPGYLPVWVQEVSPRPPAGLIQVTHGSAQVNTLADQIILKKFTAEVTKYATIRINTHYFPGWIAKVNDGREVSETTPYYDNPEGLMELALEPGTYSISLELTNTSARQIADNLTAITVIFLVGATAYLTFAKKSEAPQPE